MNQRQFVKWLLKLGLLPHQVKMAAILFGANGYECAKEFVEKVKR
jgi:hypothetical protein